MSKLVIWSDLHLGHCNAYKFRTRFSSQQEHNEYIFTTLAEFLKKRDVLYLLGDVAFDEVWLRRLSRIPCQKKILVLGNHDTEFSSKGRIQDPKIFSECFDEVHGMLKKGPFWMSHAPIHPQELRGRLNLHGHVHSQTVIHPGYAHAVKYEQVDRQTVRDKRYINACPEDTNWKPIVYQQLMEELRKEKILDENFKLNTSI